jgi:lysophospholipase L1-like esterase
MKGMKVRLLVGAVALLASLTGVATGATAKTPAPVPSHYYLALGDSLSVGFQPNPAGVGKETNQGYVNDVYAQARKKIKNLKLVQLGCPGETTTSMITGKGNTVAAKAYRCDLSGGSQLKAAEAFLKTHKVKGEVPLITVDIGANDVDGCAGEASAGLPAVEACVAKGVASVKKNTPTILSGLRKLAPKGSFLAAANEYDPILADELSTDAGQQQLGSLSLVLVKSINTAITTSDKANGFVTADVASAFGTYDTTAVSTAGTPLAASGQATVPTNVANICNLTWMCAAAPRGPNIHANAAGYAAMAKAYEAVLPKAL